MMLETSVVNFSDKMNENSNDQLFKAIKTVQSLRSSVASVFEKLENGIADTRDPQGREKVFLSDLQQRLVDVNEKLGYIKSLIIALKTFTTVLPTAFNLVLFLHKFKTSHL